MERRYEVGLYSDMASAYFEEGKHDDVSRILDEMAEKFPEEQESIQNMRRQFISQKQSGKTNGREENSDGSSGEAEEEQAKVKDAGEPSEEDASPAAPETAQSESAQGAANQSEPSDDMEAQEEANSEGMGSERGIQILIAAGLLVLFGGLIAVWVRSRRAK